MRKAAYSLANLRGGINHSARDDAFHAGLLADAKGLLFLTVGKLAFIGGVRVGTGLVVARLAKDLSMVTSSGENGRTILAPVKLPKKVNSMPRMVSPEYWIVSLHERRTTSLPNAIREQSI